MQLNRLSSHAAFLLLFVFGIVLLIRLFEYATQGPDEQTAGWTRYELGTFEELETLFEKLEYTPETGLTGSRAVPRVFLSRIPSTYREVTAKKISVAKKKRIFLQVLAPILLQSNEMILKERDRVLSLQSRAEIYGEFTRKERRDLDALAQAYGLDAPKTDAEIAAALKELVVRVDIVPLSLGLAQSAEESGWGTSRFANEGNSLFGQWTHGERGVLPKEQRASKGNYKIAAFASPFESAVSYMKNLNTHRAYRRFRKLRAAQRAKDGKLTGKALVKGLTGYSERGSAYVRALRSIMWANSLAAADNAYLADGPGIVLVVMENAAD